MLTPRMPAGKPAEEAFKRQFENDFDHFLRLRAREFAVNGVLFVVVPGTLGSSHVGEGFFTAFNDAALEMCSKGDIDSSLLADCMFPIYLPTEDVSSALPPLTCPLHPYHFAGAEGVCLYEPGLHVQK